MGIAMTCIFCKIVAGEIPAKKVYEDEKILEFHDLYPKAPVHVLVIPKEHIESLAHLLPEHQDIIAHLTLKLQGIAEGLGLHDGFRIGINTGKGGGQEVFHLHYHLLGQPKLEASGMHKN